jgi:hypothetical protein
MNRIARSAVTVASIGLSATFLLFIPSGAAAAAEPVSTTKAGIEHAERMAAGEAGLSKAQIERGERASNAGSGPERRAPAGDPVSGNNGAAQWQLAFSALLGAAVTGGVVLATRQVNQHRHAIAV